MRTRDPESKRRQLLDAARAEFAAHGVAGARVDRLAGRAGISAGLVYSFYGSKDGLYEAVFDSIVEETTDSVPIDADDLAEYAGRLYDAALARPEVLRFVAWYHLERGGTAARRPAQAVSMADKVTAIADAQRRGTVTGRLPAGEILALVQAQATMWHLGDPVLGDLVPADRRRAVIVDAVRRLTAP